MELHIEKLKSIQSIFAGNLHHSGIRRLSNTIADHVKKSNCFF